MKTRRMMHVAMILLFAPALAHGELILYYDFNDASGGDLVVDASGNGNEGEAIDAEFTPDAGGYTGQAGDRAMDFGEYGNGAYVFVPAAEEGAFDPLTDSDMATVAMWIYGNDDQPSPQWTFYGGPNRQIGAHTPWSDGTIYFDVAGCCDAETQRIFSPAPRDSWADGWNHFAFVKDEGWQGIYLNGELFHDSNDFGDRLPFGEITEFYIGAGPEADRRSYNGLIDDFAVWDNALTEEEVQSVFQGNLGGGPSIPGDFDNSGELDALDIDALTAAVRAGDHAAGFDLTSDNLVNDDDRKEWVSNLRKTWFGDANLDGEFNSGDFVFVFTPGEYEDDTPMNSTWASGDWNGDGDFTSGDFVTAFSDGGYENGPKPAVVPEPSTLILLLTAMLALCQRRK